MELLTKNFKELLSLTPLEFKRYLYSEIAWSDRMIGIVGPRGVGKTTMILQYEISTHKNKQLWQWKSNRHRCCTVRQLAIFTK